MTVIAVVGTGLAGIRAAETLRAEGHDGRLIFIGEEPGRPYDRPPLSKQVLLGETADLALLDERGEAELAAEWRTGTRVTAFDPHNRTVRLGDGDRLNVDGLVIATGVRPRTLSCDLPESGVHTLRTLADATALRDDLAGGGRIAVVGGGFIGCEVASAARSLGHDVTVVEAGDTPLRAALGEPAARLLARRHIDSGVHLVTGAGVHAVTGGRRVTGLVLADGRVLPADTVVVGIGAAPDLTWLAGSGVACADGVLTDQWGRTNVPGVVAAGDVAAYACRTGRKRVEHWTNARDMPVVAARALLADLRGEDTTALPVHDPLPYIWSDQYGSRLQFAGRPGPGDRFTVVEGEPDGPFVAVYEHSGLVTAVLGVDSPRSFTRLRAGLRRTWAS
ncbi:NAD(P)/FAD-dependent oxidoreductase [Sinosporangium siamense]|uniref:Pyridine nucleotide-disulfide oxidoreductase n=1 Tax=Sinosporangium siamense TaxID=1367973 RepID=A0A919RJW2_9ACTN|nr:FAD-dependent oxidoreductase [Sinosporangium siamense]GII95200.1 pyridine nucleotide-disulfide oxidoreductase [Sinosporangium siamense]